MMSSTTRRTFLTGAAGIVAATSRSRMSLAQVDPRVVIIGGGYGGASVARVIRKIDPSIRVTLVERNPNFVSCPQSNAVIGGLRDIASITFSYDAVRAAGVEVIQGEATLIDPTSRQVRLRDAGTLSYDRLVLSPGVQLLWDAISGYDEATAEVMPHAWLAGSQTLLLRQQLEAMEDGGLVVLTVPDNPYRCPPGPYERASMIAYYLSRSKPRSKVMIVDAKDSFSKQPLFEEAWSQLYPGMIEWVSGSVVGKSISVDPTSRSVRTDFEEFKPAVANIIPPQRAGQIAIAAGLDEGRGFCRVDARTFESKVAPGIHIIGDAIIAGGMPKSGFSANSQAKVCARAVVALLRGKPVEDTILLNTCYSVAAPGYGFSIAGAYRQTEEGLLSVEGSGGISPLQAPSSFRRAEADYAESWFANITAEMFGRES
jgi:NADPH-dependent 2,4-dienoyl-CoA reductase/sulfur reductase-like enzyme